MSVQPNAAPDEKDSPFYVANEQLCKQWETFILKRGGQIKGKYNAWSFLVHGKVKGKVTWLIEIKKSTFTGGNLLLSSKRQSLQEILKFTCRVKDSDCPDFRVVNSRTRGRKPDHQLYKALLELMRYELDDESLNEIKLEDGYLTFHLNHKNDAFYIAERLLEFDLNEYL